MKCCIRGEAPTEYHGCDNVLTVLACYTLKINVKHQCNDDFQKKSELLVEKTDPLSLVDHKSHMDWPGIEPKHVMRSSCVTVIPLLFVIWEVTGSNPSCL